jgi:hypothetical protein
VRLNGITLGFTFYVQLERERERDFSVFLIYIDKYISVSE